MKLPQIQYIPGNELKEVNKVHMDTIRNHSGRKIGRSRRTARTSTQSAQEAEAVSIRGQLGPL